MTDHSTSPQFRDLEDENESLRHALARREEDLARLQESLETYQAVVEESSDPIVMYASDGTVLYANNAMGYSISRPVSEITGKRLWDIFEREKADQIFAVIQWVYEKEKTRTSEGFFSLPDGDHYYLTTIKPIFGIEGDVIKVISIAKEITERKQMEEELRRLSIYDLLTGVYNRNFFETEVERIQNSRLWPVSIVMVDLDNLKVVNDTDGHAAGDKLIQLAASVLKSSFRAEDIIARFGGDEFVVLLTETGEDEINEIVPRVRAASRSTGDSRFSLSFGWATGEKGENLQAVMKRADDRMYQDKKRNSRYIRRD